MTSKQISLDAKTWGISKLRRKARKKGGRKSHAKPTGKRTRKATSRATKKPRAKTTFADILTKGIESSKFGKHLSSPAIQREVDAHLRAHRPTKSAKKYRGPLSVKIPDLRSKIWSARIGHYGGSHIKVPAEHWAEFRSLFSKSMFPREVRTIHVAEKFTQSAEEQFMRRFPKSQGILKEIHMATGTKAYHRYSMDLFPLGVSSIIEPFREVRRPPLKAPDLDRVMGKMSFPLCPVCGKQTTPSNSMVYQGKRIHKGQCMGKAKGYY